MRGAQEHHAQRGCVITMAPWGPLPAHRAPHSRCVLQLPQQVRDPGARGSGHDCVVDSPWPHPHPHASQFLQRPPPPAHWARPPASVGQPPASTFGAQDHFPTSRNLNRLSGCLPIHLRNWCKRNCSVGSWILKSLYLKPSDSHEGNGKSKILLFPLIFKKCYSDFLKYFQEKLRH